MALRRPKLSGNYERGNDLVEDQYQTAAPLGVEHPGARGLSRRQSISVLAVHRHSGGAPHHGRGSGRGRIRRRQGRRTLQHQHGGTVGRSGVGVVAICSPHQFHAEQVIAACRAGKTSRCCARSRSRPPPMKRRGSRSLRGDRCADHRRGDAHLRPGWRAPRHWGPTCGSATTSGGSAVLPPNPRFEDFATEVDQTGSHPGALPLGPVDDRHAPGLRGGILGLAIHDLPLIRAFLTATDRIVVACSHADLPRFGYLVVFSCAPEQSPVELHAATCPPTGAPAGCSRCFPGPGSGSVRLHPLLRPGRAPRRHHQLQPDGAGLLLGPLAPRTGTSRNGATDLN